MNPDDMIKEVNARFVDLTRAEQECIQAIQAKQADLNAIHGAKQDCQYWLAKITEASQLSQTPAPVDVPVGNLLEAAATADETVN